MVTNGENHSGSVAQGFRKLANARIPKIEKISPSSAGSQATFAFNLVILLGRGSTRPSASVQRLATRYNPLIASKNR